MSAPTIALAGQQREAMKKIGDWYTSNRQVFRLFGYAGTGKTTLARHIVDQLGITAAFAAFTGKAAHVLRSKGCDGASTIHSLIYQPVEKLREEIDTLHRQHDAETDPTLREALEQAIKIEEDKLATPDFILRTENPFTKKPLLVLDEVSMVGHHLAADLLSYGTKLLVLGDPAQLPPVDGGGYFIHATPDHLLTEIHRSALGSPVTRLATSVRNAPVGDPYLGLPGLDGDSGRVAGIKRHQFADFDQVLVGTNRTRWQAIDILRGMQGKTEPLPTPGDRIICLANSAQISVFNGQMFEVHHVTSDGLGDRYHLLVTDDSGKPRRLTVWASGFTGPDGEKLAKRQGRGPVAAATFGQAVTVHKAQGSQWDRVLVVDESHVFARRAAQEALETGDPDQANREGHLAGQRWLYTAITRAAKQVVVIPAPAQPGR